MKIAPVVAELERRPAEFESVLVHTGQHYDATMSAVFFEELGVGEPDFSLDVGSGSHAVQTARVMERLEPVLLETEPDLVLVPGDVNSTLAAALVATKLNLRVGHIEAGLRSFDRTMPEEINRLVTDQISDLLFTHSPEAATHLANEGIPAERVHPVGNTMIDTLVAMRGRIEAAQAPQARGLEPGSYLLVTLHRPALVDTPLLAEAMLALDEVAAAMPVVFPCHPRTRARIAALGVDAAPRAAPRPARLPRVPVARGGLGRRADRLGRDPGGDDLPRDPVLHAARQHRAAGHGRARDEHPARARPRPSPRDPPPARSCASGRAGVRAGLGRGGGWPNCRSPDRPRPVGFQVELTAMVNHTVEATSFAPSKRCL